jgi:serine/threonine-protein kinase
VIGSLFNGKYTIVRHLGGGAMGTVYEAITAGSGQRVALKLITSEVAKSDVLLQRFQREAKACAAVDTRHIVKVIEAEREAASGLPYMVMEYLDGEDLDSLVQRLGPLPPDLALRVAAQVCAGLEEAHKAGVVHRDIKPANIFIARDKFIEPGLPSERVVKLVDFGLAKIKMEHRAGSGDAAVLTRTGTMLGSPLYMSPEQARGAKNIDFRADLWSLGVVLYEALAGRTPYDHCDSLSDLTVAILGAPPKPLQGAAPWVPPEIAAVAHTALRLDPAERYPSAAAMLRSIRTILPGDALITEDMLRPLSDAERAKKAVALSISAYGSSEAPAPSSAAPRATGAVIAAGIVAAAAAAGLILYKLFF